MNGVLALNPHAHALQCFSKDTAEVTGLRGLHALTHVMTEMSFNGMVIRHHSPVYHIW